MLMTSHADCHNITEILLKVVLITIILTIIYLLDWFDNVTGTKYYYICRQNVNINDY